MVVFGRFILLGNIICGFGTMGRQLVVDFTPIVCQVGVFGISTRVFV